MRRLTVLASLVVLAALLVVKAPSATAAPTNVTRPPDGELRLCHEGYKCVTRAIGDFNGDRVDDLVFEVAPTAAFSEFEVASVRRFEMILGPYTPRTLGGADALLRRAAGRVTLAFQAAQLVDPLSVADVDGDGRDDLLLFSTAPNFETGETLDRILVLRGRQHWARAYNLDDPAKADIRFRSPSFRDGEDRGRRGEQLMNTLFLSATIADVNGDRVGDLVYGADRGFDSERAASEVGVLFGGTGWSGDVELAPDVTIGGMGACVGGLAGAGDVTGDRLADIVVRNCPSGAPSSLRVVAGRSDWPSAIDVRGAAPNIPTPVPDPPQPPRGGGYLPSFSSTEVPSQFLLEDLNGDGTGDLGLEFAGKTHVWYGGPDVAARLVAGRSSGVFLHAGYGAVQLTRTWRLIDLDQDKARDLLLSEPIDPALLACPLGGCGQESAPDSGGRALYVYSGDRAHQRVVDLSMDQPDALWDGTGQVLWGIGDFNGDGRDDLLLGSSPGAFDSIYAFVFGPLTDARFQ